MIFSIRPRWGRNVGLFLFYRHSIPTESSVFSYLPKRNGLDWIFDSPIHGHSIRTPLMTIGRFESVRTRMPVALRVYNVFPLQRSGM